MSPQRPRHPSGRPIRRRTYVERGFYNPPNEKPLTPRLQRGELKDAIGFHHLRSTEEDDEQRE